MAESEAALLIPQHGSEYKGISCKLDPWISPGDIDNEQSLQMAIWNEKKVSNVINETVWLKLLRSTNKYALQTFIYILYSILCASACWQLGLFNHIVDGNHLCLCNYHWPCWAYWWHWIIAKASGCKFYEKMIYYFSGFCKFQLPLPIHWKFLNLLSAPNLFASQFQSLQIYHCKMGVSKNTLDVFILINTAIIFRVRTSWPLTKLRI